MIHHTKSSNSTNGYFMSDCVSANDSEVPMSSPFLRHSGNRSSVTSNTSATLKPPKLPGTERFKFTRSSEDLCWRPTLHTPDSPLALEKCYHHRHLPSSSSHSSSVDGPLPSFMSKRSGTTRRKPIIPISRQTSRVLNNTNAELSVDTIEFIRTETNNLNEICQDYLNFDAASSKFVPSCSARRSIDSDSHEQYENVQWKPTFTTFLGSKGQRNPLVVPNNSDALSESKSEREWMSLRLRSGSSGSPSPTLSVCSSDSDVWVLRQDNHMLK